MSTVIESLPAPAPLNPAPKKHTIKPPPRIEMGDLTANNIGTFRRLNSVLFPVSYSDKFYKDVLAEDLEDFCKLAYYNDVCVGAISCKIEPPPSSSSSSKDPAKLYIATIGVLAPYRRQGIATKLIQHVVSTLETRLNPPPPPPAPVEPSKKTEPKPKGKDKEKEKEKAKLALPPPKAAPIKSLYVHVQVSNDSAKAFWERHGFSVTDTVKDYYRKIEPRDAWVLERTIEPRKDESA